MGVSLQHAKGHRERPPILDALGSMRCSSWDRSTTLFHTLKTVTKKKQWLLGEFEGRRATRHQGGEWGTDAWDGARTGVSERLPYSPATTSTRCVWTQVHAGVVAICSDQPVRDRCVVFDFVARWKEGFMSMLNRTFARL